MILPGTRRARIGLVALVLAALLIAACDNTDSEGRYVELLGNVPNDATLEEPGPASIWMADFEQLRDHHSVEPVSNGLTADDDMAHLEALMGQDGLLPAFRYLNRTGGDASATVTVSRSVLDVGPADVDAWIAIAHGPDANYFASTGRFDADRSRGHLDACDDCIQPEIRSHDGNEYYDWGEVPGGEPYDFDHLGRIAVDDGLLLRSTSTANMEQMLDVQSGAESLADDEPYRTLASEFDRLDAVEAQLTRFTQHVDLMPAFPTRPVADEATAAFDVDEIPGLGPYIATGNAWSIEGDTLAAHVLLLHDEEEQAEENAARLEQRFDEFVDADLLALVADNQDLDHYDAIEVEVRDRVLIATLSGGERGMFNIGVHPLFLHE